MKRLHVHVSVEDIGKAERFYSKVFDTQPCCGGTTFASWRVEEPPVNFSASVGCPRGALHFGLEVDSPADLRPIDRILHGTPPQAAGLPWEVSVRRKPVRQESTS
jgi:hypothetical protein